MSKMSCVSLAVPAVCRRVLRLPLDFDAAFDELQIEASGEIPAVVYLPMDTTLLARIQAARGAATQLQATVEIPLPDAGAMSARFEAPGDPVLWSQHRQVLTQLLHAIARPVLRQSSSSPAKSEAVVSWPWCGWSHAPTDSQLPLTLRSLPLAFADFDAQVMVEVQSAIEAVELETPFGPCAGPIGVRFLLPLSCAADLAAAAPTAQTIWPLQDLTWMASTDEECLLSSLMHPQPTLHPDDPSMLIWRSRDGTGTQVISALPSADSFRALLNAIH